MPEPNTDITRYARFQTAGVEYLPNPEPTVSVERLVGTTVTNVIPALTPTVEIGTGVEDWMNGYTLLAADNDTEGALVFRFVTTDPAADDAVLEVAVEVVTASSGAPTAAQNAAAVWDRLTSALTISGSIGAYLLSKVGLIGSAGATVLSPMQSNGTIRLIQAVSYDNIAQNKLRITDNGGWSSIEPDSIKFYVQQLNSVSNLLAIDADDWDWTATPKWVDVALTTTDTEKLQFSKHDYTLVATWTGTPNSYDELASGPLPAKLREWSLT